MYMLVLIVCFYERLSDIYIYASTDSVCLVKTLRHVYVSTDSVLFCGGLSDMSVLVMTMFTVSSSLYT